MALPMPTGFGAALKPGAVPSAPAADDSEDDSLAVPAQDLIDAVKAGDATRVAEALRAAHTICQDDYGAEEATNPGAEPGGK